MKNLKQKTINKILVKGSFERKPVNFKDVKTDLFEGYRLFFRTESKYLINTAGFNYCRYVILID